jgi:preprotein translocase subunit SecB
MSSEGVLFCRVDGLDKTDEKKTVFQIKCSYVGTFTVNDKKIPNESYADMINNIGSVILFPFVREHINNNIIKANIGSFLLPLTNIRELLKKQAGLKKPAVKK